MEMGQIYVEVDANAANGIMTLAESGGQIGGAFWLNWDANGGFTGTGWTIAWDSNNVPLSSAWADHPADGYDANYDGFILYVTSGGVDNLNQWLDQAGWTGSQKIAFMGEANLEEAGCVSYS